MRVQASISLEMEVPVHPHPTHGQEDPLHRRRAVGPSRLRNVNAEQQPGTVQLLDKL